MDNHFAKFTFLGVVIAVVLFSRLAYPAAVSSGDTQAPGRDPALANQSVPLYILPSVAASLPPDIAANNAATAVDPAVNGPSRFVRTGTAQPPTLADAAYLVADPMTGAVFASSNPDRRWPTASLAKLMSATIVLDKLDPNARVSITNDIFSYDLDELTLRVGGTYAVSDLLKLMLLPSSNVAAEAAASLYGRQAFIKEMNARAMQWGMTNTYYSDASGISAADQSTARDLLALAEKVYANYPEILRISDTPEATIAEQVSGRVATVKSINDFAGDPGFIGGKTGHTEQADGNLLSFFNDGGHPVLFIVLGTQSRFNDTLKLKNWFTANFH